MKFFKQVVSIPSLHAVYDEFRSGTDTTCMKNCLGYEVLSWRIEEREEIA